MELFNEIYGCYYTVVSRILDRAQNGVSRNEIETLVSECGFYDSAFHLLPLLFSGEWNLLREENKMYYSRLSDKTKRPLTILEKAWLKALLTDPRMKLFLSNEQLAEFEQFFAGTEPLFLNESFHVYDKHLDGDDYKNPEYIARFKAIMNALNENKPLVIEYDGSKGGRTKRVYRLYKLMFSARDDKFRLLCAAFNPRSKQLQRVTLNLARITAVENAEATLPPVLFKESVCEEPVILEISRERNALERCMLQFASFERQTEYDRQRDTYVCRIWYDPADETELLIRVLSFGPVVKVLGHEDFLRQVKERIEKQIAWHSSLIV